ncbi:MAG: hypothetical protein GXO77_15400 [Calditrichaeota bacterium]|nr:hypothetical protein [Calditrichota bacterium]
MHPNFLQLELGGDYNPGTRRDLFLVAPDRSELSSLEKLQGRMIFFNQRPLSLILYSNFSHNYLNRELTTNVEMYRNTVGGNLRFRNSFLPLNLQWNRNKWRQKEFATNRRYTSNIENLSIESNKSFGRLNTGRLVYNYRDVTYTYLNSDKYRNRSSEIQFGETFYFDKERFSNFNSDIWYVKQKGTQNFERLQVSEALMLKLPWNFSVMSNYRYLNSRYTLIKSEQQNAIVRLKHQLYESLNSQFYYEYNSLTHTDYDEKRNTAGAAFNYQKKIPGGVLHLYYEKSRRKEARTNQTLIINVVEESHVLDDEKVVLLDNPFVDISSIVVRDDQGIIIYQENIDYILITRGDFIEIQRLPGGQIPPGAEVLIDYTARQPIDYNYTLKSNNYGVSLTLFENFLQVYYRRNKTDYDNVQTELLRVLKWNDQEILGTRINIWQFTLGAESDRFKSNIIPYRSYHYYMTLSGRTGRDLSYVLLGNYRDYRLVEDKENQEFIEFSARINYQFFRKTKFEITGGYRKQIGRDLNLRLWTGRGEWQTNFRSTRFILGFELFRREYLGEYVNYNNTYFRIERSF